LKNTPPIPVTRCIVNAPASCRAPDGQRGR
jgi:hypothetical protein